MTAWILSIGPKSDGGLAGQASQDFNRTEVHGGDRCRRLMDLLEGLPSLSSTDRGLTAVSVAHLAHDWKLTEACQELLPYLTSALARECAIERKEAALWLAQIVARSSDLRECPLDQDIIHALTLALAGETSALRYAAAWALEKSGPAARSVIPQLQARLRDSNPYVRRSAAWPWSASSSISQT